MSDLAPMSSLRVWILHSLGIDIARLDGGTEHFRFARFPEGLWGLLVVPILLAAFTYVAWNYRHEGQLLRSRKILLACLRCGIILAAALVLFCPVLEVDRAQELRATTILLIDGSLSQTIKDRYQADIPRRDALAQSLGLRPEEVQSLSRAELVHKALRGPQARILAGLAEKNQLKTYTFAGLPLEPVADPNLSPHGDTQALGTEPRGAITDLGGALRSSVEEEGSGRVAGIVLVTDGRATAGEDLKTVGTFLASQGLPVHAVGVGDPSPARNYRVTALLASERVFLGDPVVVDVRVDEVGFDGEPVKVELVNVFEPRGEAPGSPVRVQAIEAIFPQGRADTTVSFRFEPRGIGKHRLTARIEPRPEETFSNDNERTLAVEVVKEASRVLLISGGPSYEYRFLKNLLRRDSRIFLAAWLMSADADFPQEGNVSLKKLPATPKELFEYDVVILMDPDPQGFPDGFGVLLEEFVGKRRGGLVYSAGEKFASAFLDSPEMAPVRGMLPVTFDLDEVKEVGNGLFHEHLWPLEPTPVAMTHSATRIASQVDRNRDRWAEIAGVYWSFPARRGKPAASVLLAHSSPLLARAGEPRPVIALQFYEGGRVLWCGLNSTWRWRATAEEVYDSFWVQSLRYLTENRLSGDRRKLLQTDKDAYDLGESVRVSAFATNEDFRPLAAEDVSVEVTAPGGEPFEMKLSRDTADPGWYRGILLPRSTGEHQVRMAGGPGEAPTLKSLRVDAPRIEFESPRLDEEALKELAQLTGGSYSTLAEISRVPDQIPDRRQTLVTTDEPIPLWDNSLTMTMIAGLFTLEWILRKLWRLL